MESNENTEKLPHPLFICIPTEIKDNIAYRLEEKDLGKLAQTCWMWYSAATPHLYTKNAKFGNSTAIQWVSRRSTVLQEEGIDRKILKLAVEHGADVNAVHKNKEDERFIGENRPYVGPYGSALHFAAASGKESIVEDLLHYGADVPSLSSGFNMPNHSGLVDQDPKGEMGRYGSTLYNSFAKTSWLPLLLPLIRNHKNIVRMLVDAGAPAQLAVSSRDWDLDLNAAVVTVYHLFAAMPYEDFQDGMCDLRSELFDKYLGRTPLIYAIKLCAHGPPALVRRFLIQSIEDLIEHGADVNRRTHPAAAESPLICAMPAAFIHLTTVDQRTKACADVMQIVDLLVKNGARINDRNSNGRTAIHKLWDEIVFANGDHRYLGKLLKNLVLKGGDLNLTTHPGGPTILHDFFVEEAKRAEDSDLASYSAIKEGPPLHLLYLLLWIRSPRLRSAKGYKFLQHKDHLSQGAIDHAYLYAFEKQERVVFSALQAVFLNPTNGSQLVGIATKTPNHNLWANAKHLEFDPNWLSPEGLTYLHMIVDKVGIDGYNEKSAIKDADYFIQLGISVCTKDVTGLTAIQRLRRRQPDFKRLRLFLLDERDRELGQF
ncbi:hypothetical protein TOPH_06041 [Tolypocladium ophioglossoides CBS 100239]|uniref:Ankyrin repeat protein n=1 Tax=Tolypocladium ophioglossoides (strain CBS 100239) TaxID=1163406 RepID=A0A0L0N5C1_TOLOC|nr:hypothetical protein TOPH_06041 [Tolypocladium ophioglossoides CBS 100239]